MKCIHIYKEGVTRTSNERAAELVSSDAAFYVSKSEWRKRGSHRSGPQQSKGKISIHPPVGWENRSNRKPRWAA